MNEFQEIADKLTAMLAQITAATASLATVAASLVGAAEFELPLAGFTLLDGTPLAKFADAEGATPGFDNTNSKNLSIRWNDHATPGAIARNFQIPADIDVAHNMKFHALVSKVGQTLADATTLTLGILNVSAGALNDSDTDAGGATGAVTGDLATKTVSELTRDVAHADLASPPAYGYLTVKPTAGTLTTDDFCIHRMWFTYVRRAA